MSKSIYDQFNVHTSILSAYAILHDGVMVAKLVFKYPRDGAGRLYAYAHWFGVPMVRGSANGYGYDKKSAALARLTPMEADQAQVGQDYSNEQKAFMGALSKDDGYGWNWHLRDADFIVCSVV